MVTTTIVKKIHRKIKTENKTLIFPKVVHWRKNCEFEIQGRKWSRRSLGTFVFDPHINCKGDTSIFTDRPTVSWRKNENSFTPPSETKTAVGVSGDELSETLPSQISVSCQHEFRAGRGRRTPLPRSDEVEEVTPNRVSREWRRVGVRVSTHTYIDGRIGVPSRRRHVLPIYTGIRHYPGECS